MTLARKASSRKGLKLTAQLLQQSDSLTKKDIADWRNAHQMAIDYENPNRSRLYDIYGDAVLDAHLSGCIGQRKGKTLQKDFRLVGQDGKENAEATELLQQEPHSRSFQQVLQVSWKCSVSRFMWHSAL